jgi:hypothetical protein
MSTETGGGGWRFLEHLLEGTARIILLSFGYLFAVLPIFFWPFALFIALILVFFKRTRKHAIAIIALTLVANGIWDLVILTGHARQTIH